jgi:hypothetical protein
MFSYPVLVPQYDWQDGTNSWPHIQYGAWLKLFQLVVNIKVWVIGQTSLPTRNEAPTSNIIEPETGNNMKLHCEI